MAYYPPKLWNAGAGIWNETISNQDNPHYFYYYEADLHIAELIKGAERALELGCGTGGATVKAASPNLRLVAFDYAFEMVKLAREKLRAFGTTRPIDLLVADGMRLPFQAESFDVVFCRGVMLSYVPDPLTCLREIYRVVRPGGKVGLDVMHFQKRGRRNPLKWFRVDPFEDGRLLIEFVDDGRYQVRRQWRIDPEWTPATEVKQSTSMPSIPESMEPYLKEREEARSVYYKMSEVRNFFKQAGLTGLRMFPLGCFSRVRRLRSQNPELADGALRNRDLLSGLQTALPEIFRLDAAPHIFVIGTKPMQRKAPRLRIVN